MNCCNLIVLWKEMWVLRQKRLTITTAILEFNYSACKWNSQNIQENIFQTVLFTFEIDLEHLLFIKQAVYGCLFQLISVFGRKIELNGATHLFKKKKNSRVGILEQRSSQWPKKKKLPKKWTVAKFQHRNINDSL